MNFKFNVNTNEEDYLAYNKFWLLKSPYGRKQVIGLRILILALWGIFALCSFFKYDFSITAWIATCVYAVCLAVCEFLLNPFLAWTVKCQIKGLKKKGKIAYSPASEFEFYDEYFVETTPENKTEQKYASIERVSIIADEVLYIHQNTVMCYMIPTSCFESKEQYCAFLDFLKTKCENIDVYNGKKK